MYNHYAYMSREVWNFFVEFLPINEMLGFYHLYDLPVYNFVPVYDVFFYLQNKEDETVSILVEVT